MTTLPDRTHHEEIQRLLAEIDARLKIYVADIPPSLKNTRLLLLMVQGIWNEQKRMDVFERGALGILNEKDDTILERLNLMATVESLTTDLGTLATSVGTLATAYTTLKAAHDSGVPLTQTQLDALDATVKTAQDTVNALNIPAPTAPAGTTPAATAPDATVPPVTPAV